MLCAFVKRAAHMSTIDKSQFEHFLRLLDPNAGWFTHQTFTDCEKNKPSPDPRAKVFNLPPFTFSKTILDLYRDGAGVWVTVNDTQGNGRKAIDVTRVRAVWQEDDDGYEGEYPLEPSLVIETSPGRYHRYWLVAGEWLADEQGRKDFASVMACMVACYGSDKGAKDISRCLRMPGFQHRKDLANPHIVRIVGGNRRRYTRAQILEAFPPPAAATANGHDHHIDGNGSDEHAELVRQVLTSEKYHPALTSLAWRLVGAEVPGGQVVEHLRGLMLSIPDERRDDRWGARYNEIPTLVASAEKKHANGASERPSRSERKKGNGNRKLVATPLSKVKMRAIEWLWLARLAIGKHTTLAGEPGVNKSTLLFWIAAAISMGKDWPCGEGKAPVGSVIFFSAEDGAEDTIKPRFLAAGGDAEKVHVVTATKDDEGKLSSFTLQHDLEGLERLIDEIGDVKLVIIDPITSYLGKVDGHSNTDIRSVIEPLHEMADRKKVAVLTNSHFAKSGASNKSRASHRVIGSTAFIALPRVAFAVVEDAEDNGRRLVLHVKNNIAKAPPGLAFRVTELVAGYDDDNQMLSAACIEWEDAYVNTTADEAISVRSCTSGTQGAPSSPWAGHSRKSTASSG
jgi:hypothetical protein